MKTHLARLIHVLVLVLGLNLHQTAHAQAAANISYTTGTYSIYNTQNNYFANFSGHFSVQFSYVAVYGGGNVSTAVTASGTLSPSGSQDYTSQISAQMYSAALSAANSNGYGNVLATAITSVSFSFSANSAYQISSSAPTSTSTSAAVNSSWSPAFVYPGSGGQQMFCVAGSTNWQTGSWTPTATGVYSFYVAIKTDPGYTSNTTDPTQGPMQMNFTAYTVTVY